MKHHLKMSVEIKEGDADNEYEPTFKSYEVESSFCIHIDLWWAMKCVLPNPFQVWMEMGEIFLDELDSPPELEAATQKLWRALKDYEQAREERKKKLHDHLLPS